MNIHAIQTGSVRIKTAQVEGHGHGLARRLAVFADRNWTDWLPTYAWAIEHRDGVVVVDTGQGSAPPGNRQVAASLCPMGGRLSD